MSDTWEDIQAFKIRQSNIREKLQRRKRERENLVAEIKSEASSIEDDITVGSVSPSPIPLATDIPIDTKSNSQKHESSSIACPPKSHEDSSSIQTPSSKITSFDDPLSSVFLSKIERQLQLMLNDVTLEYPMLDTKLITKMTKDQVQSIPIPAIHNLLQKFSAQGLIGIDTCSSPGKNSQIIIISVDQSKISALLGDTIDTSLSSVSTKKRKKEGEIRKEVDKNSKKQNDETAGEEVTVESLLSTRSAKEKENKKVLEEIQELLSMPTAKEQSLVEKFQSQGGPQVLGFCQYGTKEECSVNNGNKICSKLHFKKIIQAHTDEQLGDCSFLNTCFHMDTCKYVHYQIHAPEIKSKALGIDMKNKANHEGTTTLMPAQWIQCDMRSFELSTIGKFTVIMTDPPWDIHMELPYGTMSDEEMRAMKINVLQDEGYIFLWVTGRAMELGRECLQLWGYERVDELIWVKTNQLQRIIRTGRTGHWLNHGKEHCLVGVKGNPSGFNRGLDCDVIVAEVRATSHKPDEIYGIIERLSPGTRKVELFGRPHNVQPNWITIGNQLDGVRLFEPNVVKSFKKLYPDGNAMKPPQRQQPSPEMKIQTILDMRPV